MRRNTFIVLFLLLLTGLLIQGCKVTGQAKGSDVDNNDNNLVNNNYQNEASNNQNGLMNEGALGLNKSQLQYKKDELLIKFKAGVSEKAQEKVLNRFNSKKVKEINEVKVIQISENAIDNVKNALSHNPNVEFVEYDYLVPVAGELIANDPSIGSQYYVTLMNYPAAWNITTGDYEVITAAPDSGILSTHVDLKDSLLMSLAKNTYENNDNIVPTDGHGTATAGCLGATTNNGIGIASTAWKQKMIPIKMTYGLDDYAYYSDMAEAIIYAADNGARVVSLSYYAISSSTIRSAAAYLKSKGGLFFIIAGNDGTYMTYQGGDNWPEEIVIASTTSSDTISSFSSYGEYVDLSAPGSYIYTTTMSGGYGYWQGTSFATPIAASVAAYLFSVYPTATNAQVEQALILGAKDLGEAGYDMYYGHGRVDALGSLLAMESVPADTVAPQVSINYPVNGQIITGPITINVGATDAYGISKVETYIDNVLLGTDTTATNDVYSFYWDVTSYTEGTHAIKSIAYDTSGNVKSVIISVVVQRDTQEPELTVVNPVEGQTITDKFLYITCDTSANVESVDYYINGKYIGTDSVAPFSLKVLSKTYSGESVIKAIGYASNGLSVEDIVNVNFGGTSVEEPVIAECSDKKDNDADGTCDFAGCNTKVRGKYIDLPADPQCTSAEDMSESN